jgi:outer membrane protein assembly factor BamB
MITSKNNPNAIKRITRLLIGKWIDILKAYSKPRKLILSLLMLIIIICGNTNSVNANQDMRPIKYSLFNFGDNTGKVIENGSADFNVYLPLISKSRGNDWPTVAANPERTSWTPEEISGDLHVEWYRPIEAYIPENVQVIATNGLLYISTARGLVVLNAADGNLVWRYDTELPLGNSPTVANGVVYVGGYDRKIHALDAFSGTHLWSFDEALAGYSTNPLVVDGKVILGNRDGYMYAIGADGTTEQGQLIWKFRTGGTIDIAAAYKGGIIYFASNDNYAYALNVNTGAQKWRSQKLPGDGFHSYWPVVYQDKVIFSAATGYRNGVNPGTGSVKDAIGNPYPSFDQMQAEDLFFDLPAGSTIGPIVPNDEPWAHGNPVINGSRITEYLENNLNQDAHLHKPWRRVYIVLNANDGSEYTFDSDADGYPEYAPIAFWGTRSGNRYPPLVGPDSILYQSNVYKSDFIPQGKVMGWKFGTSLLSIIGGQGAVDEPNAISAGGNFIYRSICCDRVGDFFSITTPKVNRTAWDYSNTLGVLAPGYDLMWWGVTQYAGYPTQTGGYGGKGTPGSPHNGKNGIYQSHGDQNPIIPYQGRLYIHRSNAIIAYGTGTRLGNLPLVTINPVQDSILPISLDELKRRLEVEIQKIIVAGHLRPGYYNMGQSGYKAEFEDLFDNPGDTLYTLARAYPYLSANLQLQTKTYLKNEFMAYFNPTMYARIGWAEGSAREAFNLPSDVIPVLATIPKNTDAGNSWPWDYPQNNFYAMWKYTQIFPDDALIAYNLAKSALQVPVPPGADLTGKPWLQNMYIAGYIGFLNLQVLAGKDIEDSQLRTQVTNELNLLYSFRATNFTIDNPYIICNDQYPECIPVGDHYYNRAYNISRNFIGLVPELGDYLNQNALSQVRDAYDDYNYVGPYWFVSRFNATEDEGVMQPLYDYVALFQAKAYILMEPRSELTKYLDVPAFEKGDLFYIKNLIAAIEAH